MTSTRAQEPAKKDILGGEVFFSTWPFGTGSELLTAHILPPRESSWLLALAAPGHPTFGRRFAAWHWSLPLLVFSRFDVG